MSDRRLQEWISQELTAGASRKKMRGTLIGKGWSPGQVDQALNLLGAADKGGIRHPALPRDKAVTGPHFRKAVLMALGLAVILAAFLVYMLLRSLLY